MNYIVLDLEWNQSEEKSKENKQIPFEIIEIGAIKLDRNRNVVGEFSQLVKPSVYSNMHHVTKNLVHINIEELERGNAFPLVLNDFLKWCGEDEFLFCTWGSLDLVELQRNMKYYELPPLSNKPFPFLDVQKLFSIQFEDGKQRKALEHAIDLLEMEKDIPFHRAFSDAYYTTKILQRISGEVLKRQSYDVFQLPKRKKDEIYVQFDTYQKYISRDFKTKHAAMSDREVRSTRCYLCRKNAKKTVSWFTLNGKHYHCVSHCPEHGFLKGKIRLRKAEDQRYYVIKTLKLISEEDAERILEKKLSHDKQIAESKK
ncbi:MAG: exonuclease domain-containing protein [Lachnospiraceae bacterium]|nr:exonuclease domain-containing protein [Lachnospiraceae bacterium]